MIIATIGNNLDRNEYPLDENMTLREAFERAEVDYSIGQSNLDGTPLAAGDLDRTFADFGITSKCFLINVKKLDNA